MAFTLNIDFPLGYYQGRDPLGEPEPYPTMARTYSALISAAFEASLPDQLRESALEAVLWFEDNPPDAVTLPEARLSWTRPTTAYRNKGLSRRSSTGSVSPSKIASEPASRVSSLNGPVVYWWHQAPPEQLSEVISILAGEIAYIGERSSVARVYTETPDAINKDALPFSKNYLLPDSQAIRIEYPTEGRLQELSDAYSRTRPERIPTAAQDAPKSIENEIRPLPPRTCVGQGAYRLPKRSVGSAPWTRGFLVHIEKQTSTDRTSGPPIPIHPSEYVGWALALHRSIIKNIGWGAPPMITGKYAKGIKPPANHMAIHVLPPEARPAQLQHVAGNAMVVMFPSEATPEEREMVRNALLSTRRLYRGDLGSLLLGEIEDFDPSKFWDDAPAGWEYWWEPTPAAICEIRGGQKGPDGEPWTIANALQLAVGFVWRDRFPVTKLRGLPLYQYLVRCVIDEGVAVLHAHKKHFRRPSSYVHRRDVPDALTAASGQIRLAGLGADSSLVAIGQSRHLGGGLLMPTLRRSNTVQHGGRDPHNAHN